MITLKKIALLSLLIIPATSIKCGLEDMAFVGGSGFAVVLSAKLANKAVTFLTDSPFLGKEASSQSLLFLILPSLFHSQLLCHYLLELNRSILVLVFHLQS